MAANSTIQSHRSGRGTRLQWVVDSLREASDARSSSCPRLRFRSEPRLRWRIFRRAGAGLVSCKHPRYGSIAVDVHNRLGKPLWSFLRQIVPDAAREVPVRILAREFRRVSTG